MTPLDSDLLRSFLTLVEEGSVTGAAARLGRTQSAVSMQLKRLEDHAGHSLFLRAPRGLVLTPAGQRLLPHARTAVAAVARAAEVMEDRAETAPLRLGLPPEYVEQLLPRLVPAMANLHPEAQLTLRSDYSIPGLAALEAGELDFMIYFDTVVQPGQGELLAMDPTVWVTSRQHAQHLRRPLPIASYLESDWCQSHMIGSLERRGIEWRSVFECDTTHGFWTVVRQGFAVVALARSAIPPDCRELTEAEGFPLVDASCVMLRRRAGVEGPAADSLAILLRQIFATLPEGTAHAARP
ncbi:MULTISPECIES: LysR family transcriptional regulator [Gemmobacter]|jgi:DNA-binding transcriptional LysR family regulator|uniref:LysR family transcriptional regulator n=1 Tax=Gemmobacter nanjingensis TaxID=488454 RepID=A0ABQ3FC68_9RHOB|nr:MULTISPECIES: LysR family transcriptional regulator [Gemmobacter]OJY31845.1 MAG: hypothetical protein BGP11_09695 [Rhodobacterales bacterium 65-51]GHC17816.1 LysR family transcriptional regulator [Gemmobacter nanjingensis]